MIKRTFIFLIIFLLVAIFIPYQCISYKEKRLSNTYEILTYKLIGKLKKTQKTNEMAITENVFDLVHQNMFVVGGKEVIDTSVLNDFIRGIGWCDQQSFSLSTLLAFHNIQSRFLMLRDESGVSPHTIAEVKLGNEWKIIDPLMGMIFYKNKNKDLHSIHSIQMEDIENNPRFQLLKSYFPDKYEESLRWYSRMIPKKMEPIPDPIHQNSMYHYYKIYPKRKIISAILDYFMFIFDQRFVAYFQDTFLKKEIEKIKKQKKFLGHKTDSDFLLFYKARNYHLFGRHYMAEKAYKNILMSYPESIHIPDTLFFSGILNLSTKNYQKALERFTLLEKYPGDSGWKATVLHYFLGRAYEQSDEFEKALQHYYIAAPDLQTPALEAYHKLKIKFHQGS